jgi:hypothetical protein
VEGEQNVHQVLSMLGDYMYYCSCGFNYNRVFDVFLEVFILGVNNLMYLRYLNLIDNLQLTGTG